MGPSILRERKVNDPVVALYRRLALGGVGLIITGDFSTVPAGMLDGAGPVPREPNYADVRIAGFGRLAEAVHAASPRCKTLAQMSCDYVGVAPSDIPSPFTAERPRPLSAEQIQSLVACFRTAIAGVKEDGFDGVQLHAAHGGLLSRFLSPYTNRRTDGYGSSVANRVRIIREIVKSARKQVGEYPILIKMNATDYLDGGVDDQEAPWAGQGDPTVWRRRH